MEFKVNHYIINSFLCIFYFFTFKINLILVLIGSWCVFPIHLKNIMPWPVWLIGLSSGLQTEVLWV